MVICDKINNYFIKTVDFLEYLDLLKKYDNIIVLIAVKDTHGFHFTEQMQEKIAALGLKSELINKHMHSFAAIINKEVFLYENLNKNGYGNINNRVE